MKKEILINAGENETRIAITEDGRLAELFVETANKGKMVGDIYLGKVAKVMPGIKAAFIDLGLHQDGFLHFSDIGHSLEEYTAMIGDEEEEEEEKLPSPKPLRQKVEACRASRRLVPVPPAKHHSGGVVRTDDRSAERSISPKVRTSSSK